MAEEGQTDMQKLLARWGIKPEAYASESEEVSLTHGEVMLLVAVLTQFLSGKAAEPSAEARPEYEALFERLNGLGYAMFRRLADPTAPAFLEPREDKE